MYRKSVYYLRLLIFIKSSLYFGGCLFDLRNNKEKQNKGYIREESGLVFREIGKYMFVEIGKYTCLEIYGKYFGNEMMYK